MTYVFGGTLNPAQLNLRYVERSNKAADFSVLTFLQVIYTNCTK